MNLFVFYGYCMEYFDFDDDVYKWVYFYLIIVNFCIFIKIKMLIYKKLGVKICINIQIKMFCFFLEVIIGNGYF